MRRLSSSLVEMLPRIFVLLSFARPHLSRVILALITMLASSALGLVLPFVTGFIIDALVRHDAHTIVKYVLIMVAANIAVAFLLYAQNYNSAMFTNNLGRDVSNSMFARLQSAPADYFTSISPGELINRLRYDVDNMTLVVFSALLPFISALIVLVTTVFAMIASNWRLGLVSLCVVPLWVLSMLYSGRRFAFLREELTKAMDHHNLVVSERLSYPGVVRAKTHLAFENDQLVYSRVMERLFEMGKEFTKRAGFSTVAGGITNTFGPAAVMLYGAWLVLNHHATIGTITAFMGLQSRLYGPISTMVGVRVQLPTFSVALRRICEILSVPAERAGGAAIAKVEDVSMEHVAFVRRDAPVLRDLSLHLGRAEHAALVGPSGAGKSTVAQLIVQLIEPTTGVVRFGDCFASQVSLKSLRERIVYVSQEGSVFTGTIAENLRYGNPDATDRELWDALDLVGLADFVITLPHGIETSVGIEGGSLSGGERQRLSLARALLRRCDVLILDEAISAVDQMAERRILDAIRARMRGRGLLVITHRLAAIRDMDKIFVLRDGWVVEEGRYDELVRDSGTLLHEFATKKTPALEVNQPEPNSLVTERATIHGAT